MFESSSELHPGPSGQVLVRWPPMEAQVCANEQVDFLLHQLFDSLDSVELLRKLLGGRR